MCKSFYDLPRIPIFDGYHQVFALHLLVKFSKTTVPVFC